MWYEISVNIFKLITSPVHVVPVPSNPVSQAHVKLPSMFVHTALSSQLLLAVSAHSSMSVVVKK